MAPNCLQYMAGMGVNFNNAPFIGEEIGRFKKYPEGMFTGSVERMKELRAALGL